VARFSAPGLLPRAGAVLGGILLGAASILPMLGVGSDARTFAFLGFAISVVALVAGVSLLVVTRARAARPAEPVESPTLVA